MISGLHFDVSAEELTEILQVRIEQCDKKITLYQSQAKRQAELTKELGVDEDMPKHSGDQSANLEAKAEEYRQKKKEFEFLRDHAVKGETYRLDRGDLQYIGVVKSRY